MRRRTTSEVGHNFEDELLRALGPGFAFTTNSGSKWKDGDIRHKRLVCEAKVKNSTKGFSAPIRELKKLWKTAASQFKDWLYFQKNGDSRAMVLMDLETFLELSEDWRNKHAS